MDMLESTSYTRGKHSSMFMLIDNDNNDTVICDVNDAQRTKPLDWFQTRHLQAKLFADERSTRY